MLSRGRLVTEREPFTASFGGLEAGDAHTWLAGDGVPLMHVLLIRLKGTD